MFELTAEKALPLFTVVELKMYKIWEKRALLCWRAQRWQQEQHRSKLRLIELNQQEQQAPQPPTASHFCQFFWIKIRNFVPQQSLKERR